MNTLISVRQVSQCNAGRRTAGIDRVVALDGPVLGAPPGAAVYIPKANREAAPARDTDGTRKLPGRAGIVRVPESFVTVTHPFHPLWGQRLQVLSSGSCLLAWRSAVRAGCWRSVMLPLASTDRGPAADGPLTYEVLINLAAEVSAVSMRHAG